MQKFLLAGYCMPFRSLIARELSDLYSVLAHPMRLRLIEELGVEERGVKALCEILSLNQSNVSQHLSVLRMNRLVLERRQGRNVFYRLRDPQLASWVLEGVKFVGPDKHQVDEFLSAVEKARNVWASGAKQTRGVRVRKERK